MAQSLSCFRKKKNPRAPCAPHCFFVPLQRTRRPKHDRYQRPCTKMARVIPPTLVDLAKTCKQGKKETNTEAKQKQTKTACKSAINGLRKYCKKGRGIFV
ncbi:hypothetical protein V6Z12_D01G221500 [Gossypium hirsutum]